MSKGESHDNSVAHSNRSDEEDEGEIVSDEEEGMQVDKDTPTLAIRYDIIKVTCCTPSEKKCELDVFTCSY